jgi:hypothetical protein
VLLALCYFMMTCLWLLHLEVPVKMLIVLDIVESDRLTKDLLTGSCVSVYMSILFLGSGLGSRNMCA